MIFKPLALIAWMVACIFMFPDGDRFAVGVFLAGLALWILLIDIAYDAHMDSLEQRFRR